MSENSKIALLMLGETIDFYNDNGYSIDESLTNKSEEDAVLTYDEALKSIQKRYDVFIKLLKEEEY